MIQPPGSRARLHAYPHSWYSLILAATLAGCAMPEGENGPESTAAIETVTTSPLPPSADAAEMVQVEDALTLVHQEPAVGALLEDGTLRPANETGRVMVLEYHLIGEEGRWSRDTARFRQDLELLYERGYRPVSVSDLLDGELDLPAGLSPVVFTFDDASPSQFRYLEAEDGSLSIDPTSAVGIWLEFASTRPDWHNRAVFCMLPAAEAGRAFFGEKGIEGQKSAWRFRKVKFLADQGFELCNHTLWHANLGRYDDEFVQEQIARGVLAIDSVVPGYRVRTFALPLGVWPQSRELAWRGSWTDPQSGREIRYDFDAVLEVSGGPTRGPNDSLFTRPARLNRVQVYADELERTLDRMDRGLRYVSAGAREPATTRAK